MIGILQALDQGVGGTREQSPDSVERDIDARGKVAPA
jgi:hypothetical protein